MHVGLYKLKNYNSQGIFLFIFSNDLKAIPKDYIYYEFKISYALK